MCRGARPANLWKGSKAAGREPSLTSMDIHTPSIPPKLRITQTLVEDLFYRPVDVAKVIWPDIELDWFQRTRLKRFCLTPRVIDLSGGSLTHFLGASRRTATMDARTFIS